MTGAPHDWMHRENQERFIHIEHRLDILLRALSVLVECDDLEEDPSMECIVRYRDEHKRLLLIDRRYNQLAEQIGKWIIRGMAAFVVASSLWAVSNIEILRRLWH